MNENNKQASDQIVRVSRAELPAYCPTEAMGLWNSHPRVYIALEESPAVNCPYCGTRFELAED